MPYPFKRAPLPSIVLTTAADTGIRRYCKIEQNSFTYMVFLAISLTLTVSVAAATVISNKGSVAAAFDLIGIEENGYDRVALDAKVARFLGELNSISGLSSTRLTVSTIAAYNLREVVPIFLSLPQTLDPAETAFREKDPTADTNVFVQLANNAAARIASGGGSTVALTNINVDVMQVHNRNQKALPYYVPQIRQVTKGVAAANTELEIPLFSDRYLAQLVISQEASGLEVGDIINKIAIRSDVRDYIGPKQEKWINLCNQSEYDFGGNMQTLPAGAATPPHFGFNFTHHGQLSRMVSPNETNLRILADVQPGAGVAPQIRVTLIEMSRDLGMYVGPGGLPRQVCDPTPLPWQVAA